jgi:hypothetical protein
MAITETMTKDSFISRFNSEDGFSYDGLCALYDYLNELSDDSGEDIKFDRIALRCEYDEYSNLEEYNKAYGKNHKAIEFIGNYTVVIDIDGKSFIVQAW